MLNTSMLNTSMLNTSMLNTSMLRTSRSLAVLSASIACGAVLVAPAAAAIGWSCPPAAEAVAYGDGLDKAIENGATVGGLSSLAWDTRTRAWVSAVDNHGTDPARIWFWRDPLRPRVTGDPLVLRRPDGTAYDGTTADDEGLAVLPDGDYLVSSETEPSIRIFGRDGVQKASLPIPARFAVAPAGEATANATLEGLTIAPSGRRIVAAMEGALSGDVDPTLHRFLVYSQDRRGRWTLAKQVAYRTQAGMRVPEVAAYGRDSLLVMEASYDPATGNTVDLYAVRGLDRAPDVSGIRNLSDAPALVLPKSPVADLVDCPSLGAPAREPQANPLLDNYEGMAVAGGPGVAAVELISDDNFSPLQFTRVLTLAARLP
jgi:Esterase-like activity of phytase